DRLLGYERQAHRPTLAARLAIIVAEHGVDRLRRSWRLSNDEVTSAEAILGVVKLLQDSRLNDAAYRYPAALADGIDVAAVLADWSETKKSAVLAELRALVVPEFPVRGGDLVR